MECKGKDRRVRGGIEKKINWNVRGRIGERRVAGDGVGIQKKINWNVREGIGERRKEG